MSKILAIEGHPTRGSEIIALLEMMGGVAAATKGFRESYCYYISEDTATKYISWDYIGPEEIDKYEIFTIEEFLKKYPYKVGDKVTLYNKLCTVIWMCWECDNIYYQVQEIGGVFIKKVAASELIPYKEQGDKETKVESKREYDELRMPLDDDDKLATEATIMGKTILPPDGYLVGKITQTDNGMLVEYVEKKPKYPKLTNLSECKEILGEKDMYQDISGYKGELLTNFQRLLIFRDAYWKIAGEQMGLSKPWEPTMETVYCISRNDNVMKCSYRGGKSNVLEFPTEEMRDAFYENFKELIEYCKELL